VKTKEHTDTHARISNTIRVHGREEKEQRLLTLKKASRKQPAYLPSRERNHRCTRVPMPIATAATSLPWGAAGSCLRASSLRAPAAPDVFPASASRSNPRNKAAYLRHVVRVEKDVEYVRCIIACDRPYVVASQQIAGAASPRLNADGCSIAAPFPPAAVPWLPIPDPPQPPTAMPRSPSAVYGSPLAAVATKT
jgi:hypothetical protein